MSGNDIKAILSKTIAVSGFEIIVVCDGDIEIDNDLYHSGDTIPVTAYYGNLHVSGNANILKTYIRV